MRKQEHPTLPFDTACHSPYNPIMVPAKFLLLLASSSYLVGQRIDIASSPQTLPGEDITFGTFTVIDGSGDGNFLFVNQTIDRTANENEYLFFSDAAGNLTRVLTEGQSAPVGQGTIGTLSTSKILGLGFGKDGTIALTNELRNTSDSRTVLAWNASSGLRQIAREGLPFPDGSRDDFEDFLKPVSVSQTGNVTLTALRDEEVIFQESINGGLSTTRPLDLRGGNFIRQGRFVDATDSGQIVIGSLYREPDTGNLVRGIFDIENSTTLIDRVLSRGQAPTPGSTGALSDGTFGGVVEEFSLNASRSIAFFSIVDDGATFGDGIFYQRSNSSPIQAVIRENQVFSGGAALDGREATFVGTASGIFAGSTFLLADDQTVYVSGPITIANEVGTRFSLIRWTPDTTPEVLLIGNETLPDANPTVTLEGVFLQDVSSNGAVSLQAQASNNRIYPYHYHPETGLTLLANFGDTVSSGTISLPVILGPELDDNGNAIFTFTVNTSGADERVLSLFDTGITPVATLTLPAPCITVTANTSEITLSQIPNNLSLRLQRYDETNNQFVNFGSLVTSANAAATLPGPDPTTDSGVLLRVVVE